MLLTVLHGMNKQEGRKEVLILRRKFYVFDISLCCMSLQMRKCWENIQSHCFFSISNTLPLFGPYTLYMLKTLYLIYVFCMTAKNVLKNSFCFMNGILFLQQCFLVCTSFEKFMARSTVWSWSSHLRTNFKSWPLKSCPIAVWKVPRIWSGSNEPWRKKVISNRIRHFQF